ncbi:MAG: methyltransferase domain-containing protein [Lachnospiraceae bacterium]|nr:methyltransferase domain-containing protein [Lachnospiraceae bacterium]
MNFLEEHYNKFFEEKRLNSRHGQVEYRLTMKYIIKELKEIEEKGKSPSEIRIADIGAGTGRYAIPLSEMGYEVTAVEPVQHNLGVMKAKKSNVTCMKGNALKLKKLEEESFDLVLMLGPMYHLFTMEDKKQAMSEAKRIAKPGAVIFVAYLMNEYGVLTYGFKERHILEVLRDHRLDDEFSCSSSEEDLYDYVRIDVINELAESSGMKRKLLFTPDGPADYMRRELNQLSEEEFEEFVRYVESICERQELIGAAAHTVDILQK